MAVSLVVYLFTMGKIFKCSLNLMFILVSLFTSAQSRTKKAIFIIADGIPSDIIEKLNTPNLKAIAAQGTYLRAHVGGEKGGYSQTPTISANGYNSLLTATWVNKHNVWGNDIKAPNYNYWNIFRLIKEASPKKTIGIFSSWTDNRTKLIGDKISAAGNIHPDFIADGFELDTLKFPHDEAGNYMHLIDEQVVGAAASTITKSAPDLSWVYLEYTDDMGHRYGDSPQYYNAIEKMDAQVGKIWQAIQYRQKNFKEDWLIFVTTDHGRDEKSGKNHGGQSDRQRSTWMVTNYKQLNNYAQFGDPAIVDITPSILQFLQVKTPVAQQREMDGTPLIGSISVAKPKANFIQHNLDISWKAMNTSGKVKIWITATNNFKEGKADDYQLLAEVPVIQQHALVSVKNIPSSFYKICIEGQYNTINRWVLLDAQK